MLLEMNLKTDNGLRLQHIGVFKKSNTILLYVGTSKHIYKYSYQSITIFNTTSINQIALVS